MAYTQNEMVELGGRFSTQRLIEQIPVSIASARTYQESISPMFPAGKIDALESSLERIKTLFNAQNDSKYAAATGNVSVDAAMKSVKSEVRDMITIADNTFEEEPEIRDEFHKGGPLGRSVPGVVRKAETIFALAEENQEPMVEWGLSDEKLAVSKASLTTLIDANTAQEQAMKNLPAATRELYEEKARAYLLLKKLARVGRRKFAGTPAVAAKFSLEILNRKGSNPSNDSE